MLPVFMDRDDPNPGMPWASRLEVAELIELARCKRIELGIANPRKRERTGGLAPYLRKPGIHRCCTMSDGGLSQAGKEVCPLSDGTVPSTTGEQRFWLSQ